LTARTTCNHRSVQQPAPPSLFLLHLDAITQLKRGSDRHSLEDTLH
jgi:hypothetical protein